MGMKAKSGHFGSNQTSGGPSTRKGLFQGKTIAQNKPDSSMPPKGKKLYNAAQDQALKNQIVELYRPGSAIGDGGTADALRYEKTTGKMVGGKSHYIKAKERLSALKRIVASGRLSSSDETIANELIADLEDAIGGNFK